MKFVVEWTIDIEADDPVTAAREAFAHMQRPGTTANCFKVFDERGDATDVDLEELAA